MSGEISVIVRLDSDLTTQDDVDHIIMAAREFGFALNTDDAVISQMHRDGGLLLGTIEPEFLPNLRAIDGVVAVESEYSISFPEAC